MYTRHVETQRFVKNSNYNYYRMAALAADFRNEIEHRRSSRTAKLLQADFETTKMSSNLRKPSHCGNTRHLLLRCWRSRC